MLNKLTNHMVHFLSDIGRGCLTRSNRPNGLISDDYLRNLMRI